MTRNRMGDTHRKNNRKVWLTGTVALGALAASGGVATAALAHSSDHSAPASQRSEKGDDAAPGRGKAAGPAGKAAGQVCLRLDAKGRQAIANAEAAATAKDAVVVPMNKVEVIPCPRSKRGTPPTAPGTSAPAKSTPNTSTRPTDSTPAATTSPAGSAQTTAPVPAVTSAAS